METIVFVAVGFLIWLVFGAPIPALVSGLFAATAPVAVCTGSDGGVFEMQPATRGPT